MSFVFSYLANLNCYSCRSLFDPKQSNLALLSSGSGLQDYDGNVPNLINSTSGNQTLRLNPSLTIDNIRQLINAHSLDNNYQNPGLYADQVIHKVIVNVVAGIS